MDTTSLYNKIINNKTKIFSVIFLVVATVVIIFLIYSYNQNRQNNKLQQEASNQSSVQVTTVKNTSEAGLKEYSQALQEKLEDPNLDELQKKKSILEKAFIGVINRIDRLDMTSADEARKSFTAIYESTSNTKDLQLKRLNNYALFGFVFSFAENCFSNRVLIYMPEEIRKEYFFFWYSKKPDTATYTAKEKTKETFKGFIQLVDDDNKFDMFKNDKSFNSYSAVIKATYLDSYKDEMSKEEINSVVKSIEKDIEDYKNGQYISVYENNARITMLAPLHFAFADYAIKQATKGANDYSSFEKVYKDVMSIQTENIIGKTIVAAWALMYELGAMNRANASDFEVKRVVDELNSLVKENPQIAPVVRGYLSYGLLDRGRWTLIKQDIYSLAKKSNDLKLFLDDLGLKDY